jgi:kynureninase
MQRIREKSESLTGYLEFLLDQHALGNFTGLTPREADRRGAQLSIRMHHGGRSICDRLIGRGVVCDWREPDILRVAPVPLYNTYTDAHRFFECFIAAQS